MSAQRLTMPMTGPATSGLLCFRKPWVHEQQGGCVGSSHRDLCSGGSFALCARDSRTVFPELRCLGAFTHLSRLCQRFSEAAPSMPVDVGAPGSRKPPSCEDTGFTRPSVPRVEGCTHCLQQLPGSFSRDQHLSHDHCLGTGGGPGGQPLAPPQPARPRHCPATTRYSPARPHHCPTMTLPRPRHSPARPHHGPTMAPPRPT